VNDEAEPVHIVTGRPGCGKSALIGMVGVR